METRVEKYKDYRASFLKQGSENYVGKSKYETRTIPIAQVMQKSEDKSDIDYFKKKRNKRVIIYLIIGLIIVIAIAGLIVWGIVAFK